MYNNITFLASVTFISMEKMSGPIKLWLKEVLHIDVYYKSG